MHQKFRVLKALAIVFKIVAWVGLACSVMFFFIFLVVGSLFTKEFMPGVSGGFIGLAYGVLVLVYGVLGFIFLYAGAEIIYVLLSIEDSASTLAKKLSEE